MKLPSKWIFLPGWIIASLLLFSPLILGESLTLYLSPEGRDQWSGRLEAPNQERTDGPLASLAGARDAARAARSNGKVEGPIIVEIADGVYPLLEPVVFLPEDSGSAGFPVIFRAAANARPVFDGGRRVTGFAEEAGGLLCAVVGESFEQAFVNGRRAQRVRSPNAGTFIIQGVEEEVLEQGTGRAPTRARQTLTANPGDLAGLTDLSPEELGEVVLTVYHKWDITRRYLERYDAVDSSLITSGQGMKPWNSWKKGQRFYLENFRSALDTPGEWFLDRNLKFHYLPLPGEDPEELEVIRPAIEHFLLIQGRPEQSVEYLCFEGLSFRHGRRYLGRAGFEPSQAAHPVDAVILADHARAIRISDCRVERIGSYAIWFRKGCTDCCVERCYLHDLGAGGVRIGETVIAERPEERTGFITVDNCIIHSGGHLYPPAVGVWIGQSGDNQVSHNEIADLRYTGISLGWRWGYAEGLAKNNRVEFNHIHHIGQGMLSDMGGVYTLGPSQGTTVSHNVIHDVQSYAYGGWGLYNDEGSTGITMKNNLVYRTKTGGYHQHYGRDNLIQNNIFAFAREYQLQYTRVEEHLSFSFLNNIVYYSEGVLLAGPWQKGHLQMSNNLYWHCVDGPLDFCGLSLEEWQGIGRDVGSLVADPGFVDPLAGDFRIKDETVINKIGFKPFDYSKAGCYGEAAWIALSRLTRDEQGY